MDAVAASEVFCVHKQAAHDQWMDECCYQTEVGTDVTAIRQSTASMGTCRVYDATFKEVTMVFEKESKSRLMMWKLQRDH